MFKQSYFALFELPESYLLDTPVLIQRFRALQKTIHPDKFAGHTEQEQRLAVQFSAWVNQAYQCLKSPVKRAEYLLSLRKACVASEHATLSDPAFLMQQMHWREALLDLTQHPKPLDELHQLQADALRVFQDTQNAFAKAFEQQQYTTAQQIVHKLHFIEKFLNDLRHHEDTLIL